MNSLFFLKLILSFLIAGFWIIIATVVADKLGSKIGGLISGLPSTIMFGLFFIGWTQGSGAAVQATTITPIIAGLSGLFLTCYTFLVKKGFWLSIIISISVWLILSFTLIRIHFDNLPFSLVGYLLLVAANYWVMEKILKIKSTKGKKVKYTKLLILSRGVVGGMAVALAVFLGKVGGPMWGGTFSMFPAIFISTIFITYFTHGPDFSAATMKSAMVSASSTVLYSMLVRFTYLDFGLVFGTLVSILVAFGYGALLYKFVITRLS